MGKPLAQITQKCTCSCHNVAEGDMIMHMMACCDSEGNTTVEIPLSVTEYFYMTAEEIIEKFSDVLSEEDKEKLKEFSQDKK